MEGFISQFAQGVHHAHAQKEKATTCTNVIGKGMEAADVYISMTRASGAAVYDKRSAHDALRELHRVARKGGANVIFEADVKSFFDKVHRRTMLEMLGERIADKSFMRLVGKCLNVGVLEGQVFTRERPV